MQDKKFTATDRSVVGVVEFAYDSEIGADNNSRIELVLKEEFDSTENLPPLDKIDELSKDSQRVRMSLEYLEKIVKLVKKCRQQTKKEFDPETVVFEVKTDMPIFMTFENESRKVRFIVAPRVED